MNIIRLGQDEIVDAGVLDEHGHRLTWTYDLWLALANHALRHLAEAVLGRRKLIGWVNEAMGDILAEAA